MDDAARTVANCMEDEPGEMTRQEIIDEVAFTLGDEVAEYSTPSRQARTPVAGHDSELGRGEHGQYDTKCRIKYQLVQLLGRLKAATKSLLRRPDLRTEASHFVIKGLMQDSGRVEPLDLLRDQLISHKRIIRVNERSRALDKDAAYAAITQAFEELSGELADAAGLAI